MDESKGGVVIRELDKVNVTVRRLTDYLEHCAVVVYEELARGQMAMEEANGSQYSFQLAACGRQITIRGRGLGMRGEG